MATEPGLRERKKQQTRQHIFETAVRLFTQHGFDAVTVAQVARAADVSEPTVFNYFPTKEDLFFGRMEFYEDRLIDAVRDRPPGESALAAFRRLILDRCANLAADERTDVMGRAARIIGTSPSLQARELEVAARSTRRLASLLAEEMGAEPDDMESAAVASALIGTQRALTVYLRTKVQQGLRGSRLAADAHAQAVRAFARLAEGLATYGRWAEDPPTAPPPMTGTGSRRGSRKRPER